VIQNEVLGVERDRVFIRLAKLGGRFTEERATVQALRSELTQTEATGAKDFKA
jgi:hypothetical protein